ncbi:MAG: ABC transporter permease [Planktomarina sp.]
MGSIARIVAQRLVLGVLTMLIVSIVIFVAVNALPGDFSEAILGQGATEEAKIAIRKDLGLDQPYLQRYFSWLGNIMTGDLGISFSQMNFASNLGGDQLKTVADQIYPRFINTMWLAGFAALIAVPLSLTIGVLAALYRNSIFDRAANIVALTSISSPEFFIAYILVLFFAVLNPVFLPVAEVKPGMDLGTRLYFLALPALTLTLVVTAHMMRMTRASIINLLASPYIEMARLKGISPMRVIVMHALPNALAPIINVIALNLAYLITGVVVVEVVFTYPGIGQLFVDSVINRDIPVIQACVMIFASAYILLNLTADILTILTNPKLRHPK